MSNDPFMKHFGIGISDLEPVRREPPAPVVVDYGTPTIMFLRGKETEFFYVSSLARALNRSPVTIRSWEDKGRLPNTPYRTPKPKRSALDAKRVAGRRLYTRQQLDAVVAAAKKYKVTVEEDEQLVHPDWTSFTSAVVSAWNSK